MKGYHQDIIKSGTNVKDHKYQNRSRDADWIRIAPEEKLLRVLADRENKQKVVNILDLGTFGTFGRSLSHLPDVRSASLGFCLIFHSKGKKGHRSRNEQYNYRLNLIVLPLLFFFFYRCRLSASGWGQCLERRPHRSSHWRLGVATGRWLLQQGQCF